MDALIVRVIFGFIFLGLAIYFANLYWWGGARPVVT